MKIKVIMILGLLGYGLIGNSATTTEYGQEYLCKAKCKCYGGILEYEPLTVTTTGKGTSNVSGTASATCTCNSTTSTCTEPSNEHYLCADYCRCYGGPSNVGGGGSTPTKTLNGQTNSFTCQCNQTTSTCVD